MRLLPAGLDKPSDWEDGLWEAHPGFPAYEGSWIHPPVDGHAVPEFEFEEGHDKNRNMAPPVLVIGNGNDVHIRQADERIPRRLCQLMKLGRDWYLEGIQTAHPVYHGDQALIAGQRLQLKDQDTFSLLQPPTQLTYRICINDEDNWYLDDEISKDFPNKHRSMFPYPSAHAEECPDELKRLAWQTDQMRRRSEEDQVRVADWAAFSQYVKRHYLRYGIECKPWIDAKRPHDEKPPSYEARAYPSWVADIVKKERQLPGISTDRPQAFASSLSLSGVEVMQQMEYKGGPPKLEELYTNPVATGPAVARATGSGVEEVAEGGGQAHAASGKAKGGAQADVKEAAQNAKVEAARKLSFNEWLASIDQSGFMMQYHDQLSGNFDSLAQVVDIYVKNGEIQKAFFEDAGIKKLGHRRIFEKWFQDNFRSGGGT